MTNPIFSYTHRDYEGARKEGLAKIPILSKGQWTDLNATDPGIIILDYVHALVDMIQYYQDHQALETFMSTAKERANIFRIAKQLSYSILSAKGASVEVTFSTQLIYKDIIKIPRYTSVSTLSGINYLTTEDAYLMPGEHTVTVRCSQGTLNTYTYTGTGISRLSNVENAANQMIILAGNNIDIDSISIEDSLGRVWKAVDYIVFSGPSERAYQLELNPDDSISVKFGDGERGMVPGTKDSLTIKYVTTLAAEGRVGENAIVVLNDTILDNEGKYVELYVNNNRASVGGSSSQSSREIKEIAPGVIKAQDRAVTLRDFENLAKLVDGVHDAKAYDINTKPDLCLYHEVKVLITPEDLNSDLEALKQNTYDYLAKRMIPPTNLQILSPSYKYIDISVTVSKLNNTTEGRLSYAIQEVIKDYFNERVGSIGEAFYPSDLSAVIRGIEGVRSVLSISPASVVSTEDLSVILLRDINITVV